MIEVLLIIAALALVAACGAFVAAEFAFVTVDRGSVERAAESGDKKAAGVLAALQSLSTQLSAAQVGITLTNLLIGFLAEPSIARLIDGPLESAGVSGDAVTGVALVIALTLATGVTMVFGELVPKNLAITKPLATARAVQGFQRGFTRSTGPIVRFFNGTANAVLRRLGVEPQEELASARSPEELASLVRHSASEGTLEVSTATLLQRSLAFTERRAHEIMTPRGKVCDLDADAPVLTVVEQARASGHSRFPVTQGDAFVGVAHIKDAVTVPFEQRGTVTVAGVMKPPLMVPASLELDHLLEALRRGGLQMALVVDEFGNVDGLVTLEDLVEEIVGEVQDEHDPGEQRVRREADGGWVLSGLLRPDEVHRATAIRLPEDRDYETVAGLVADQLARMPETGDAVELPAHDRDETEQEVRLTVLAMDGLRVDRIRLELVGERAHGV
jgi:CBS domain containing-hemolysin-like protein